MYRSNGILFVVSIQLFNFKLFVISRLDAADLQTLFFLSWERLQFQTNNNKFYKNINILEFGDYYLELIIKRGKIDSNKYKYVKYWFSNLWKKLGILRILRKENTLLYGKKTMAACTLHYHDYSPNRTITTQHYFTILFWILRIGTNMSTLMIRYCKVYVVYSFQLHFIFRPYVIVI